MTFQQRYNLSDREYYLAAHAYASAMARAYRTTGDLLNARAAASAARMALELLRA